MKITINEQKVLQLEELFNGITLKTPDGEEMHICMRDSGFEFTYEGKKYSAQKGVIKEVLIITSSNSIENNNCSPYVSDELKK
jgi:hypothetical protein